MGVVIPLSCSFCGGNRLNPVIYAFTEPELEICGLGWAMIGSKIDGPPHPLWYCINCRRELTDDQLILQDIDESLGRASARWHRVVVQDLLERVAQGDQEQHKRMRGRRWFDMVCQGFSHDPDSIHIDRRGQIGVILLRFSDRITELSTIPSHMLDDLVFFLQAEAGCADDIHVGGALRIQSHGRLISCRVTADTSIALAVV